MKQLFVKYRHFIVFSLIGAFCVVIDFVFYLLFLKIFDIVVLSKICSSIISVSVNYLLNSRFNFDNKQKVSTKFYTQYLIVYAFLIGLNALFNSVFLQTTGSINLSFWLAAIIAAFTNYAAIKIFFKVINRSYRLPI